MVLVFDSRPLVQFDCVPEFFPVATNHPRQFCRQGVIAIAATDQVMGQPVLIFFQAHYHSLVGGECRTAWRVIPHTMLFLSAFAIKSWVLVDMTIATFVSEKAGVRNPRLAGYSLGS